MGNILNINKEIKINNGDLNLYIDIDKIKADGTVEVIGKNIPAKSLVANFARMLMMAMANINCPNGLYFVRTNSLTGSTQLAFSTTSFNTIASVIPGNPTRVVFSSTMSDWNNTGNEGVQLMGIGGISPDINGFWTSANATYIAANIVDLNIDTTGSPAFIDQGARVRIYRDVVDDATDKHENIFGEFKMVVGRGSTPNITDQQSLKNEFDAGTSPTSFEPYELLYTDTVVSAPSFNYTSNFAELFFSGIVSNNSGISQNINEIGLYNALQHATSDHRYTLIARDLISPGVTLNQGESAAVTYRLRTGLDSDGGILEQFIRMLYRQLNYSGSDNTIIDINGDSNTFHENQGIFHSIAPSGEGTINGLEIAARNDVIGIQVGTDNTAVQMDDRALGARIDHGEDSGELIHYGQIIDDFEISGNTASFKLIKYFENVSGGSININEVGVYSSANEFDAQLYGIFCIYREVLSATQVVANGEIVKVVITFRVTVV